MKKQTLASNPTSIGIVGYGKLGRQTLSTIIAHLKRDQQHHAVTFYVADTAEPEGWRKNIQVAGQDLNIIWGKEVPRCDVLFMCVPSGQLENEVVDALADVKARTIVIRTTADPDLLDEVGYTERYANSVAMTGIVYAPELAREAEIERGNSDTMTIWASSKQALADYNYSFDVNHSVRETFEQVALYKLLNNALIATLFSFKNHAAELYRQFNVTKPIVLDAEEFASDLLYGQSKVVSFGGKCLRESLRTLDRAVVQKTGANYSMWNELVNLNADTEEQLGRRMIAELKRRNLKAKRKRNVISLFGLNCHVDNQLSWDRNCISMYLCQTFGKQTFVAHPMNPPQLMKHFDFSVPAKLEFKHVAAAHIAFVMPYSARVNTVRHIINANHDQNINYLNVFDPLGQFTTKDRNALQKVAASLNTEARKFDLQFITNPRK